MTVFLKNKDFQQYNAFLSRIFNKIAYLKIYKEYNY